MGREKTDRQDIGSAVVMITGKAEELIPAATTITYAMKRDMRKDPTIALGRSFSVAPILTSEWSIQSEEDVPEERIKFIRKEILPWRLRILNHALFGGIDFGWTPFELIFKNQGRLIHLDNVKHLLPDLTRILVSKRGKFKGFKQTNKIGQIQLIRGDSALLISFRVEGTMWYGEALLNNAYVAYTSWNEANSGAARYDKKIAGSHFVVYYPPGSCLDADGDEVENHLMAKEILLALESSGSVAVPTTILEHIEELDEKAQSPFGWRIEILEDRVGRQASFVARLKYLDTLKIRGLIMPERSMMEGSHGTLAEASAHIDLALTNMDFMHMWITETINRKIVDVLLRVNWGMKAVGSVWLVPSSLVSEKRVYLQRVYLALLARGDNLTEPQKIDLDAVKDLLGIPKASPLTETGKGPGKSDKTVVKETVEENPTEKE